MLGSVKNKKREIFKVSKLDKYKGIIPAFYACFHDDEGNIVLTSTSSYQHYVDRGAGAIICLVNVYKQ